jgi:chromate reductase, NAD(P)H dehydrogenase (quinone)
MKKVMAMVGSLSARSSNLSVVEYVGRSAAKRFAVEIFDGIRGLPQFNPDLEIGSLPAEVVTLRHAIAEADMILISTPEYVFGVPGSLKNALDWTVSSADFRQKPVALIVASLSGEKAFESLLKTLETLEADVCDGCKLLISHIKAKLGPDGEVSHEPTRSELAKFVDSMARCLQR